MGNKLVIPETDSNITKCIKNFRLTPQDISEFWNCFQKLDKSKSGVVSLNAIFKSIDMERNLLTDCLLELLEIEHDGEINFSDFLMMVTSYCFFEPTEILRFCFYTFDQDKTGFFSVDDLNALVNVVHNIKGGNTVKGNVKMSWMKLTFESDQIDFSEFSKISNAFPRLFEPAFRLQQQMMNKIMGGGWWNKKKRDNQNRKDEADMKIKRVQAKKEARKRNKKNRKIQRSMGLVKFYICPCLRKYYDPSLTEYDHLSEEEKLERDKQLAIARRQAELRIKNPETAQWKKYEKKVVEADAVPNGVGYVAEKIVATERPREVRAESRAERRKQRNQDPELQLKPRTTVSGADI